MPSAHPKSTALALTLICGSVAAFISRDGWYNGGQPLLAMGPTTHKASAEITGETLAVADTSESLTATLRRDSRTLSHESDALRKARATPRRPARARKAAPKGGSKRKSS